MKNFNKFVCFDTETESLNLRFSRPWQISWVVFDHSGKVYDKQDRILDIPNLKVGKGAIEATGFSYEKWNELKENPLAVYEDFRKYLLDEEYGIVFHNGLGFDVYQVRNLLREIGHKDVNNFTYLKRCIDTHALAKGQKMGLEVDKENFLSWQYKVISEKARVKTSVPALLKEFNIDHDPEKLHDALYDVEMDVEIFQKLKFTLW